MKRVAILLFAAIAVGAATAQIPDDAYDKAHARAMELASTDRAAAIAALEPLADSGHAEATNAMAGLIELDGPGWRGDAARAEALYEKAAKRGSSTAALNLAFRVIERPDADSARTIELIRQAEEDPRLVDFTAFLWGRLYLFGWGVERDMTKGVELITRFVEKGKGRPGDKTYAHYLLGRAHDNGWGVDENAELAYLHMRAAADSGDQRAQWYAAMMLLNGSGVEADETEAYELVKLSAEQGYLDGMISRAVMLATGQGVEQDAAESREWYGAAARQGSAHALRGLGGMVARGEGGPAEPANGIAMLELAAEAGDEIAPQMIDYLMPQLRPNRSAIDRARTEWLVRHGAPSQ